MARGKPTRSPGKGVLVDTWTYDATYSADAEGEPAGGGGTRRVRKVDVELRLVKEFDGASESTPQATRAVSFRLTCKEIDLSLVGTDVEALRKAMWERLDERFAIPWKPWLLVRVEHRGPYNGSGTGFVLEYTDVERGVAFDGSVLMREYRTYGERGYHVAAWPEQFRKNGRTLACIEATPGNRAALEEFCRRIDALRDQLAEFVRPEAIARTLADLSEHMSRAGSAAATPLLGKPPRED